MKGASSLTSLSMIKNISQGLKLYVFQLGDKISSDFSFETLDQFNERVFRNCKVLVSKRKHCQPLTCADQKFHITVEPK